jgi:hypothetical protein
MDFYFILVLGVTFIGFGIICLMLFSHYCWEYNLKKKDKQYLIIKERLMLLDYAEKTENKKLKEFLKNSEKRFMDDVKILL